MNADDASTGSAEAEPPRRRGRVLGALAAVVAVVAVAIAGVGVLGGDKKDSPAVPAPVVLPDPSGVVVDVPAGTSIQAAVDANPAGTTFRLGPGLFQGQGVTPKAGDVFEGAGVATVLDGSTTLTGWAPDGRTWSVSGLPAGAAPHGQCRDDAPRCDKSEELFRDGVRLRAVDRLSAVDADSWWFDDETGTAHVGADPTGASMLLSVVPSAFDGDAPGVTIRDLTVTHYATRSQRGAINALGAQWTIEGVVASDNHAVGIYFVGDGTVIRDVVSRGNGQMGISGSGSIGAVVERVELADNNQARFDDEWEGGGAKFTKTTGVRFVDSFVHGNDGAGIWFDESAQDTVIDGNRSEGNSGAGIFYEISRRATISNNVVRGNGFGEQQRGWLWGGGIQVAASWEVTVVGNEVAGNFNAVTIIQQDRGSGPFGRRSVEDVTVTGNSISLDGGLTGAVTDERSSDLFGRRISFEGNTYVVDPAAKAFAWDGDEVVLARWNELGFS